MLGFCNNRSINRGINLLRTQEKSFALGKVTEVLEEDWIEFCSEMRQPHVQHFLVWQVHPQMCCFIIIFLLFTLKNITIKILLVPVYYSVTRVTR